MSECVQTIDPNSNGYSRFDLALSTVISCNVQKSTISKTYESSLFLYGQGVTKNDLQDSYEDVEEKVRSLWNDIQIAYTKKNFEPNVNKLCDWCAFQSICPAWNLNTFDPE